MKEHHLSNPRIDEVLGELAGVSPDYDQQALRRVQKDNPARPARALAGFLIAKALREEADTRAQLELAARAFEGLAAEFGDVELKGKGESVAKLTKKEVSAIRLSPVGWVVRDIEGEDLDGQRFKLSDYRGKVVLLDFWGHW